MSDWQPVCGWPQYEVSRDGRVRKAGGDEIGQWLGGGDGRYPQVRLSGPRRVIGVHRLVAAAFVPNPTARPCVNHIDNDPANNRAENLEWCTQAENLSHAAKQERMQRDYWVGKRPPSALLSDGEVREIRESHARDDITYAKLADRFRISKRAIGRCINRETYADVQ